MRTARSVPPLRAAGAALVLGCLLLAGCGAGDDPVAAPAPRTTEPWPWEKYPPTPTPSATTATPSPAPPAAEPAPTGPPAEPTAAPSPTATRTAEPEPTEEPEPEPEPSEPDRPPDPEPTEEPEQPGPDPDDSMPGLAQQVVDLTNEARRDHGCQPLRADDRLHEAGRRHSEDMAERDYFDHVTPEGVGPGERAERAGYERWGGENIAWGYRSAEAVLDGWMNSSGHRANILNCDFRAIGVGVADSRRGLYWTQNFGFE